MRGIVNGSHYDDFPVYGRPFFIFSFSLLFVYEKSSRRPRTKSKTNKSQDLVASSGATFVHTRTQENKNNNKKLNKKKKRKRCDLHGSAKRLGDSIVQIQCANRIQMIRHYTATVPSYIYALLPSTCSFFLLGMNRGRCFLPFNCRLLNTILCPTQHGGKEVLLVALPIQV